MRCCMLLATCRHTHSLAYAGSGGIRDGSSHKGFLMIKIFLRQILAHNEFLTTSNSFIARTSKTLSYWSLLYNQILQNTECDPPHII